ncbi:MAG: class I SAM-dependent methyltransferase [Bacteriovorax sp.]
MDDTTFDKQTAQDWINAVEKPGKSFRDDHIYPKLNNLINIALPKTILDIGCGQGICSDNINLRDCKYTGIEPSHYLLDRAKQIYSQANRVFLQGNAYELPISDNCFEAAFSVMVWHLLSDIEKAARELSRVLTENGNFLIITANPDSYSSWKAFYPDAKLTGKKLEGTMRLGEALSHDVLYLHTFDELKDSLQKAGLNVENTETFLTAKDSFEAKLLISIKGRKFSQF